MWHVGDFKNAIHVTDAAFDELGIDGVEHRHVDVGEELICLGIAQNADHLESITFAYLFLRLYSRRTGVTLAPLTVAAKRRVTQGIELLEVLVFFGEGEQVGRRLGVVDVLRKLTHPSQRLALFAYIHFLAFDGFSLVEDIIEQGHTKSDDEQVGDDNLPTRTPLDGVFFVLIRLRHDAAKIVIFLGWARFFVQDMKVFVLLRLVNKRVFYEDYRTRQAIHA